eukprot:scaffold1029_cov387-Prasinococcus_capsulatus_cf.AAC.3
MNAPCRWATRPALVRSAARLHAARARPRGSRAPPAREQLCAVRRLRPRPLVARCGALLRQRRRTHARARCARPAPRSPPLASL